MQPPYQIQQMRSQAIMQALLLFAPQALDDGEQLDEEYIYRLYKALEVHLYDKGYRAL